MTYCPSQTSVNYTMNRITFTTFSVFRVFLINYRLGHSHNKSQKFVNSLTSIISKEEARVQKSLFLVCIQCVVQNHTRRHPNGNTRFSCQSLRSQKHSVFTFMKNIITLQISKVWHSERSQVSVFLSFIKFESLVASDDLQRSVLTIQSNNI